MSTTSESINRLKTWRSWYITGECPSPSEWRNFDVALSDLEERVKELESK